MMCVQQYINFQNCIPILLFSLDFCDLASFISECLSSRLSTPFASSQM